MDVLGIVLFIYYVRNIQEKLKFLGQIFITVKNFYLHEDIYPHIFKKIHATQMKLSEIRKQFHKSKFRD